MTPELLDRCTEVLCRRFEEMTGCPITVEDGPLGELEWSSEQAGRTSPGGQREGPARHPDDHPADPAARPLLPGPDGQPRRRRAHRPPGRTERFPPGRGGRTGAPAEQQQFVRQVAGRLRLRAEPRPALRPGPQPASMGQDRAHGQRDLVSHRLHPPGRGAGLRSGFAPVERTPGAAAGGREGGAGGSAQGVGDRLSRARRGTGPSRRRRPGCACAPSPTTATWPSSRRRTRGSRCGTRHGRTARTRTGCAS